MIKLIRNFFKKNKLISSILLLLVVWLPFFFMAGPNLEAGPVGNIHQVKAVVIRNIGTITPTPLPEEYLANKDQTIGIMVGGIILILIVVTGTLGTIRRKR